MSFFQRSAQAMELSIKTFKTNGRDAYQQGDLPGHQLNHDTMMNWQKTALDKGYILYYLIDIDAVVHKDSRNNDRIWILIWTPTSRKSGDPISEKSLKVTVFNMHGCNLGTDDASTICEGLVQVPGLLSNFEKGRLYQLASTYARFVGYPPSDAARDEMKVLIYHMIKCAAEGMPN